MKRLADYLSLHLQCACRPGVRCATACCTTGWPAPKLLGRPYWGTHDNAAGQKSMVLLRAIHDKSNNALIGSLFLGVRPSHFGAVFDVSLGAGSAMFVIDADAGKVVIDPLARNARSGVVGSSGGAQFAINPSLCSVIIYAFLATACVYIVSPLAVRALST